ncbi:MAG: hypothetical protein ABI867_04835 [Kofleriaceae bacterium]
MNCQRAVTILSGFTTNQLAFAAAEIEQLLAFELVIEADPDDFKTLQWIGPAVRQLGEVEFDDPTAPTVLAAKLAELDDKLKRDWYRFTTSDDKLKAREQERRTIRRALGYLNDRVATARIAAVAADARKHLGPNGGAYNVCPQLGSEVYALTLKGNRVGHELSLRLERYREADLAVFMKAFEKTDAKMAAFSGEIATLSNNIGYVKKNPHQIVIGLAKTGAPAAQALDQYRAAGKLAGGAPDVAVTIARNAAAQGSNEEVQKRWRLAQNLLQKAGFPATPVVAGAAKTLLPFPQLAEGVQRFVGIAQTLENTRFSTGEATIKYTARLMPAVGEPPELVGRVKLAFAGLNTSPSSVHNARDESANAVALASMVKSDDAVGPLVARFRAVEVELVQRHVSTAHIVDADALECVACPGTPAEVAETVRALMQKIAAEQGRQPGRADVAVAVAFAKRFAY